MAFFHPLGSLSFSPSPDKSFCTVVEMRAQGKTHKKHAAVIRAHLIPFIAICVRVFISLVNYFSIT